MTESYDLSLLAKLSRSELLPLLQSVVGAKSLVLETDLLKPLDRIVSNSALRQMDFVRIYRLETLNAASNSTRDDGGCMHRFFLLRPSLTATRSVLALLADDNTTSVTLLFWPRRSHTVMQMIEAQGLHGRIAVEDFDPGFLALGADLLSLERPDALGALLDGDGEPLRSLAAALLRLRQLHGDFGSVTWLGEQSGGVAKLLQRLGAARPAARTAPLRPPTADLILIDRRLDFASVLLSGLTYDALLDDVFGETDW